ncbi:MAG: TonB-dependent receptor [Bacteroidales bacterium]|nr:TonB-dependent receptor [Bacteroidales bacterium]
MDQMRVNTMFRPVIFLALYLLHFSLAGQDKGFLKGKVTDGRNGDPMVSVSVSAGTHTGTITDTAGHYLLSLSPGHHTVSFYFIGYETDTRTIHVQSGKTVRLDIGMHEISRLLDEVVISAARYEEKLSEVTVSMEVLKTYQISNRNITSLDMILEKTSGINILDGQPSIRGGSGYSYGAGSRVLMLVDDMPMIAGDAGDIKWSFLPVENVNQVEVIKGASSVLYGSSALNGVIHLRNRFPGNDPETEITLFSGLYMKPERRELVWWEEPRWFGGGTFSHLRKIGGLDLMVSGNYFRDNGYRELEDEKRGRVNLNMRYRFSRIQGLFAGFSSSIMSVNASDFLLWQDADSGAYRQNPMTYVPYTGLRYHVDPYLEWSSRKGGKHTLKSRIFTVGNVNADTSKSSYSRTLYGDYRYQKNFRNGMVWSSGASVTSSRIIANFFENHSSANYAVYSQLDARLADRLKLSGGIRWEMNMLDGAYYHSLPVLRSGVNYQAGKATFLRGSFGQGYRFPSLAEKYATAEVGGLKIFRNPVLEPEKGWSAEIGARQGIAFGNWKGFGDLALFWTRYNKMIEYSFGLHPPDSVVTPTIEHLGFKALNIGNARITGAELTFTGEAVYRIASLRLMGGYTFMQPVDLDRLEEEGLEPDDYILKYRHKHALKVDAEIETRRILIGTNLSYSGRMVNVDEVFIHPLFGNLFLPGYPDYRENNPSSHFLTNLRIAWKVNNIFRINVIARNLFNKEYIGRPGDLGPPRNITLQLRVRLNEPRKKNPV